MTKTLDELVNVGINKIAELAKDKFEHVYVLDTNVVHGFPEAIGILAKENETLKDDESPNMIVITDIVRSELNGLKKSKNIEKAIDARTALRGINKYIERSNLKPITEKGYNVGATFENGSVVMLLPYSEDSKQFEKLRSEFGCDDKIISAALTIKENIEGDAAKKVSVISDDYDMRSSCWQFDMPSERFDTFYKDHDYTGFVEIDVNEIPELYNILIKKTTELNVKQVEDLVKKEILPNQFLTFVGNGIDPRKPYRVDTRKEKASSILRNYQKFLEDRRKFCKGDDVKYSTDGLKTLTFNYQQECAIELSYDPNLDYVSLSGPPGVGKTLIGLHTGMIHVLDSKDLIRGMLVANPPNPNALGFLPGTKNEKLRAENQNIFDALESIFPGGKQDVNTRIENMILEGTLELETLSYVKGRTLMNRWIVLDEVEDYDPRHMRKLISRLGKGSKMILCGDPDQVDGLPGISRTRNGLVYLISKFKGQPNYGHLRLTISERHPGAEQAARLL